MFVPRLFSSAPIRIRLSRPAESHALSAASALIRGGALSAEGLLAVTGGAVRSPSWTSHGDPPGLSGKQIRPEDRLAIRDVVNAFGPWGVPDTARAPRTAAG